MDQALPDRPSGARDNWIAAIGLVLLATVTFFILRPALGGPMVFDDRLSVTQAQQDSSWLDSLKPDPFALYRPVKNLFFYGVEQSGGLSLMYHVATLAAFLVAMVGVFSLVRQLTRSPIWALVAAAIWTLSAPNATIAAWASCFNISVAAAGMTFGLAAWDRWRATPSHWPSALVFFTCLILALFSYETAIAMAPLAVLIDLYRGRRPFARDAMVRYGSIAVVVLAWMVLRHVTGAKTVNMANPSLPPDMESWKLTASAPYFLWSHFLMWAAPWGRLECLGSYLWNRSIPAAILPFCWFFLLGIVALGVRFWRPGNLYLVGLAWFLIAAIPSGNFVPLGNTPYADYYVPIPAIGLAIALAELVRICSKGARNAKLPVNLRGLGWAAVLALVGWRLSATTAFRSWGLAWSNPAVVMAETAAARPYQYLAKAIVADIMLGNDALDTAEWYARSSMNDSDHLGVGPTVLGEIAYRRGRSEEALGYFRQSLNLKHINEDTVLRSHLHIGQILAEDPAKAEEAFSHLVVVLERKESKYHIESILSVARMYELAGQRELQITALRKGVDYHPTCLELRQALHEATRPIASTADDS